MLAIWITFLLVILSVSCQLNDQIYYPGYFDSFQRTTTRRYFSTQTRPPYNNPQYNQYNNPNPNRVGSSSQPKQRISEQKCQEYSKLSQEIVTGGTLSLLSSFITIKSDKCDTSQGLIIGGENAKAGEFPHMVAIGYKSRNNQVFYGCGGSLISERFVLTAAHCRISGGVKPSEVRIGDLNLKIRERELPEETIPIDTFIYHEKYIGEMKYDIALIKLTRDVTFGKHVRPACLMTQNIIKQETATATGWGYTNTFSSIPSDTLQKVDLNIIESKKCFDIYNIPGFNNIDNSQFCAGKIEGGKDTCRGDSGGPLQVISENNKCTFIIIGVTSYGSPDCGAENSPGVYTKVSAYIDWIEKNVWKS